MRQVDGDCTDAFVANDPQVWTFTYDGDGVRVMEVFSVTNGTTQVPQSTKHYFAGGSYEVEVDHAAADAVSTKKYYSIAGMRVAMDDETDLVYFASDHLSSTSIVMDASGTLLSEQRYLPFGEVRSEYQSTDGITETDFGYTGQRNLGGMGLMDYNARFYSPLLGRFIQPDSIVPNPGDSQAWNRYSYVGNNPLRFTDPTGHKICEDLDDCSPSSSSSGSGDNFTLLYDAATDILEQNGHCDDCDNSDADDLEAMAQIIEAAAEIYGDEDVEGFLDGLTRIFTGAPYTGWNQYLTTVGHDVCNALGSHPQRNCGNEFYFKDQGFHPKYKDGKNQVYHSWAALASTANENNLKGTVTTMIGNMYHETVDPNDPQGKSIQDYNLTKMSMTVGALWYQSGQKPSELADYVRDLLGER